jgi:hypothetical protein
MLIRRIINWADLLLFERCLTPSHPSITNSSVPTVCLEREKIAQIFCFHVISSTLQGRVCRTVITRQRSSNVPCQPCQHQAQQVHRQEPFNPAAQAPLPYAYPIQAQPYNFAQPYYYNPPRAQHPFQYMPEPPPAYPGFVPISQAEANMALGHIQQPYPTAPPPETKV